jgi:hypothetical protein
MTDELIGRITSTDIEKRTIMIDTWDGKFLTSHPFHVMPEIDVLLRKQKTGYFVKVTYEGERVKNIQYAEKPKDWPQGKAFQKPRNEKLIIAQVLVKAWTELYCHSMNPEQIDFNEGRRLILEAVRDDLPHILSLGGEQK